MLLKLNVTQIYAIKVFKFYICVKFFWQETEIIYSFYKLDIEKLALTYFMGKVFFLILKLFVFLFNKNYKS